MKDHTAGGGITAAIVLTLSFFFIGNLTRLETGLLSYILGLFGYFAYVGLKKYHHNETAWEGDELLAGFFASLMAFIPSGIILAIQTFSTK